MAIRFTPIRSDPPADQVRTITLVPFLPDGRCVLVQGQAGFALPSGEVRDGEDYLIDTRASATSTSARSAWTAITCTAGSRALLTPAGARMPSRN